MQIKEYLDEILNLIAENPFILSQSLSFEERSPYSGAIPRGNSGDSLLNSEATGSTDYRQK